MERRIEYAVGLGFWLWAAPTLAADVGTSSTGAQEVSALQAADRHFEGGSRDQPAQERKPQAAAEEIDTKNLFGFTLGSDTLRLEKMELEGEGEGRIGRRTSRYDAGEPSLRLEYGATKDFSISAALFGDYHRVVPFTDNGGHGNNAISQARGGAATGETVTPVPSRMRFNGGDIRLRYRVLDRVSSPVGLTLQVQPSRRLYADDTGVAAESYLSEQRLILDAQLAGNLFLAANLVQEVEATKPRGVRNFDEASKLGATFAATTQVSPGVFLGGELQYLRAYQGLGLNQFLGEAVYLGPTFFSKLPQDAFLTLSYNLQVAGAEEGNPDARRDLTHFERQRFLIRAGFEF